MNGIEKETTEICKQIQNLTKQIEENIKMIENNQNIVSLKNIKINIIEKDDDKETVDLFMEDLQKMDDKKEVSMNKIDESEYILFDDLE